MPIQHVVEQGQCLSSIAKQYNFPDWHTIYEDSLNEAFRQLRPDPNVIYPGDTLYIPDKKPKTENRSTTQVHTFQLAGKATRLRIVIQDVDGTPVGAKNYKLTVDGDTREGTLPPTSLLDEPIPADALVGELAVWVEERRPDIWKLQLGHLDPIEKLSGVQGRLNNLGYFCGHVDGIDGPRTQAAVKAFQTDYQLLVDGIAGPQTKGKLKEVYGF